MKMIKAIIRNFKGIQNIRKINNTPIDNKSLTSKEIELKIPFPTNLQKKTIHSKINKQGTTQGQKNFKVLKIININRNNTTKLIKILNISNKKTGIMVKTNKTNKINHFIEIITKCKNNISKTNNIGITISNILTQVRTSTQRKIFHSHLKFNNKTKLFNNNNLLILYCKIYYPSNSRSL